ncbi:MAG: hypothetical protein MUF54_09255 [Polyangiaceae bacterium]|jgi:tetratricopeptide (TPR) repeat protein|nr:hypothetical protein [Polyangiaceae bacterium]
MHEPLRARLAFLAVSVSLLGSRAALADDYAEFEKARNPYSAGRYDVAAERFAELLDPGADNALRDPNLIERARTYRAASLIALGSLNDADAEIERVLRTNPNAFPDPVVFPTQVLDRFTDVRTRIRDELEAKAREKAEKERGERERERAAKAHEQARVAELERLARQQVRVVENSRWISLVPFGVGQFQNDQDGLGWAFFSVQAALATTTIVTAGIHQSLQSRGTEPNIDKHDLNARSATMQTINNAAWIGWALATVGGVVHAQLTFVPEKREVRQRELPERLRAQPSLAVAPEGGGAVGLVGMF